MAFQPQSQLLVCTDGQFVYRYIPIQYTTELVNFTKCLMPSLVTLLLYSLTSQLLSKHNLRQTSSSIHKLTEQDGILYNSYRGIKRIFIPESLRPQLCQHFHENHGHPGISKTIQLILAGYWWPNSTDEITQYVKSCKTCQLVKKSNQPTIGLTNPPPTPSLPMETWALDTIVMGSSANNTRAKYIQLIVDHHSRYVWAYATPKNTTATIINILTQLFTAVGKPQTLTTDNFKSFQAKQFRRFLSERNIRHIMCSPYHPQSNGICEKANDTIVRGLRLARFDQPNLKWSTLLSDVVNNYNRTPHSATGFAPKFLHFAESENETSTDINQARKLAKVQSDSFKDQRKHNFDERHKPSNFTPGDLVIRILPDNHPTKLKLSPAHTGPFVIREQLGPETYRISPEAGVSSVYTAHASQLRRFLPRVETHGVGGVRRTDETEPVLRIRITELIFIGVIFPSCPGQVLTLNLFPRTYSGNRTHMLTRCCHTHIC